MVNNGKPERFTANIGNISQIIMAIVAIISIIFTYITVTNSLKSLKEEKKSKRPYFALVEAAGVQEQTIGSTFCVKISIMNVGIHPATNIAYEIIDIIVLPNGKLELQSKNDFVLADDLPQSIIHSNVGDISDVRIPGIGTKYILNRDYHGN